MDYDLILARYGEIGLKSPPVRRRFEQILQENIERAFEHAQLDCFVERRQGRLFITTREIPAGVELLRRVFGLTSVSPARVVPSDLPALLAALTSFFDERAQERPDARTFAVRARRTGQHPYTSQDLARQAGAAILDRAGGDRWRVDLTQPHLEVFVEVRDNKAYLFGERVEGPGGLPVGSQGRVVVLLKDVNSLVAAWLMMKRGCSVIPIHYRGPTGNSRRAQTLLESLRRWHFLGELVELPHEEANEFPRTISCSLCMRQMIRKADAVARRKKAKAIVTGEAFSSSTIENLTLFGGLSPLPILRPVLGMTPDIMGDFSRRLGLEVGRNEPLFEPCPLRTYGRTEEARVREAELELGLEARAYDSARLRPTTEVLR